MQSNVPDFQIFDLTVKNKLSQLVLQEKITLPTHT